MVATKWLKPIVNVKKGLGNRTNSHRWFRFDGYRQKNWAISWMISQRFSIELQEQHFGSTFNLICSDLHWHNVKFGCDLKIDKKRAKLRRIKNNENNHRSHAFIFIGIAEKWKIVCERGTHTAWHKCFHKLLYSNLIYCQVRSWIFVKRMIGCQKCFQRIF